jgi:glucosamine--fructose-6-phosphate aminotransferase (isomerizing)
MPSFLPGSSFNRKGECHWCQIGFPCYQPKGSDSLREFLNRLKGKSGTADCLVGVSGGKDSCYVLLELKLTFGMRVEAFTYSHFGHTAFAQENAKAVCESLKVKHHVVELPRDEHLLSFRAFFKAWLDSPRPIPAAMTCVACKHLHLLGSRLAEERHIPALIWATCPLEISPMLALKLEGTDDDQFRRQGLIKSASRFLAELGRSIAFARAFLSHPRTSALGCLAATPKSRFVGLRYPSQKQIMFFDYCDWNPDIMRSKLTSLTEWRKPEEFADDWHSDCVFNIFKEYMFQKMHGISYTDGFISNQIRYGILSREAGWNILLESKRYYAEQIYKALDFVGLKHLSDRIDPSCFEIRDTL